MSEEFLGSNFWLYWRTMFAFENWHSALEFKLYLHRFIHHIKGLPDLSALKFTKYNQYESLVLPLYRWLLDQGLKFEFSTVVTDVDFDIRGDRKQATRIHWTSHGQNGKEELGENDLLFMTIGSLTENSDEGDHHTPAQLNRGPAPAWDLWRTISAKDPAFGRPDVFAGDIDATKWESCTVTTLDRRIPEYIQKICKRDPFSGKVVTGGIVTARDSSWLLSWTVNRQPHFKQQPDDQIVVWVYALFSDVDGVRDRVLHAAPGGRPPRGGARGLGELRVHRPVLREPDPGLHLHHRVFGPHTDGGGVHPPRHRARRP